MFLVALHEWQFCPGIEDADFYEIIEGWTGWVAQLLFEKERIQDEEAEKLEPSLEDLHDYLI